MDFFKKKERLFTGTLEVNEMPEAKIFHIPSKFDLKTSEFELKSENIDQRVLVEILGMITGAECKRPFETGKLDFNGSRADGHIEVVPADRKAKVERISKIQSGEEPELYDFNNIAKQVRLPHTTTKFRCPDCEQSLFMSTRGMTIVRDIVLGTDKSFGIPVESDSFPNVKGENGEIDFDKVVDIYNDCIALVKDIEAVILVSNSEDEAFCLICGGIHKIKDFVAKYEDDINENKCDICGGQKESTLTNNGEKFSCANNDCYNKLNKNN